MASLLGLTTWSLSPFASFSSTGRCPAARLERSHPLAEGGSQPGVERVGGGRRNIDGTVGVVRLGHRRTPALGGY
jgi:hypothetical protein